MCPKRSSRDSRAALASAPSQMIPIQKNQRQITAILPAGVGQKVVELLSLERGLTTASLHRARGVGIVPLIGSKGVGAQVEWELVTVIVARDQADEIFEYIFRQGDIDRPHGGFLYMGALQAATQFLLPDVADDPDATQEFESLSRDELTQP